MLAVMRTSWSSIFCLIVDDFSDQRPRFYSSPNLKDLFTSNQILSFLKAIGLYGKF